jgi:hypothetical protein
MKPYSGKKHSAETQVCLGMIHTGIAHALHQADRECETICSLVASMALDGKVVNQI